MHQMAYRKKHYQRPSKFHRNGQYDFLEVRKSWKALLDTNDDDADDEIFDKLMLLKPEKPIRIALLDSGIWIDHCAFSHCCTDKNSCCKTKVRKCQQKCGHQKSDPSCCMYQIKNVKLSGDTDIEDTSGHGTSIASLIIGGHYKPIELSEETSDTFNCVHHKEEFYNGIAPFSKLISFKVLRDNESNQDGAELRLIEAIEWCLRLDEKPDIMSISIGFDDDDRFNSELYKAINEAVSAGIIVVCCASNEGSQNSRSIKYPAKFGNVICVGSHDTNGKPSLFSSHGRELDFLGPGERILSASTLCDYEDMDFQKQLVACEDGTSYSAPFIAGMCALLLMYTEVKGSKELRKEITNTLVMKTLLQKSSTCSGSHDPMQGYGQVRTIDLQKPKYLEKLVDEIVERNVHPPPLSGKLEHFYLSDVLSKEEWNEKNINGGLSDTNLYLQLYQEIHDCLQSQADGSVFDSYLISQNRNNQISSALGWLSEEYYGPKSERTKPDILIIPFGLPKFNKHIYEKINEMSRSGTIVVTAAAERESTYLGYPGCYGDVLCVGAETGPKGRELDFIAHDLFMGSCKDRTPFSDTIIQTIKGTAVAATYVGGIIANLLTFAEVSGGPELRRRICYNGAMRALLQSACTTPGQHIESTGHGMLEPLKLVKYGTEHFKTLVDEHIK